MNSMASASYSNAPSYSVLAEENDPSREQLQLMQRPKATVRSTTAFRMAAISASLSDNLLSSSKVFF